MEIWFEDSLGMGTKIAKWEWEGCKSKTHSRRPVVRMRESRLCSQHNTVIIQFAAAVDVD